MASTHKKPDIVTFKADGALLKAMSGIPNRSDFIRTAILAALDSVCPLCKGTGILNPNQKDHWKTFALDHAVQECGRCGELHLVCANKPRRGAHGRRSPPGRRP